MRGIFLSLLSVLLLVSFGIAQEQETIDAKATVLSPISFPAKRDLDFGSEVLPGRTYTVLPGNGTQAGRFELSGADGKEVSLSFSLPTDLDGPGANTISITFSATSATHATNLDYVTGATSFNPASGATTSLNGLGSLYIALGGEISPPSNQVAGAYSATITLTVEYTGQ
jgi:hypothetical protein